VKFLFWKPGKKNLSREFPNWKQKRGCMEMLITGAGIVLFTILTVTQFFYKEEQTVEKFQDEYRKFVLGRIYDSENWKPEENNHE
jgi:hypothetical protein